MVGPKPFVCDPIVGKTMLVIVVVNTIPKALPDGRFVECTDIKVYVVIKLTLPSRTSNFATQQDK